MLAKNHESVAMHIRQLEKRGFASVCVTINTRIASYILIAVIFPVPLLLFITVTTQKTIMGQELFYIIKTLKGKTRITAIKMKLMILTAKCIWMDDKINEDIKKIVNRTHTGQNFEIQTQM
jgi:hypothetical protein